MCPRAETYAEIARQKDCREDTQCYLPSPEEIAAQCRQIQAENRERDAALNNSFPWMQMDRDKRVYRGRLTSSARGVMRSL